MKITRIETHRMKRRLPHWVLRPSVRCGEMIEETLELRNKGVTFETPEPT